MGRAGPFMFDPLEKMVEYANSGKLTEAKWPSVMIIKVFCFHLFCNEMIGDLVDLSKAKFDFLLYFSEQNTVYSFISSDKGNMNL